MYIFHAMYLFNESYLVSPTTAAEKVEVWRMPWAIGDTLHGDTLEQPFYTYIMEINGLEERLYLTCQILDVEMKLQIPWKEAHIIKGYTDR